MACVSKQPPTKIVRNHLCGAKSYCAFSHATRNFQTEMKLAVVEQAVGGVIMRMRKRPSHCARARPSMELLQWLLGLKIH